MGKKIPLTDRLASLIAKSTDNSVDPTTVSIYETIAINSLPVSKAGSLFDGAVMEPGTMQEMADYVNNAGAVPMHTLHNQGGELPVGRVFYAEPRTTVMGTSELRSLFYIPNSETAINDKLDSGVLDEVSIGFRAKAMICSKCNFDYMSQEATMDNIWSLTCSNDHTIGVDGTHTLLRGLDKWMELSLVSKGAAKDAKILARSKQLLGADVYNQLAASGKSPLATTLFGTATKERTMDINLMIGQLSDAKADTQVKAAEIVALKASNTEQATKLTEALSKITLLEAKTAAPDVVALQASADTNKALADKALAFVRLEADRLCVASGQAVLAAEATFEALTASIEANRLTLSASLPTGGRSNSQETGSGTSVAAPTSSAFKLPR